MEVTSVNTTSSFVAPDGKIGFSPTTPPPPPADGKIIMNAAADGKIIMAPPGVGAVLDVTA